MRGPRRVGGADQPVETRQKIVAFARLRIEALQFTRHDWPVRGDPGAEVGALALRCRLLERSPDEGVCVFLTCFEESGHNLFQTKSM